MATAMLVACPAAHDRDQSERTDWLAHAQEHITAREYRASENGQGLQAPNRAHNLRTYFDETGIRVHDRTAAGSAELLRLSLAAVGRGKSLAAVAPGVEVVPEENRVEIRRGGLVEWYVNSEDGLEQGFTLAERPTGDGPLVVELAVTGAPPALQGNAIIFATGVRKLRYGQLVANDRGGDELPARFELASAGRLRIVVDDTDATYPVVIDPLLTETADSQVELNQLDAWLGAAVNGSGDVNGDGFGDVIVGAPFFDGGSPDEGAAFVFHGLTSGITDGDAVVTAATQLEANQSYSQLGKSVSASGDVDGDGYGDVIVGAPAYSNGQSFEGAAFIFHGSAAGIADGDPGTAATQLESDQANAELGVSVAGAGDVNGDGYDDVIVGAHLYDSSPVEDNEGYAFVFLGGPSGIVDSTPATAATRLESNQVAANFGRSVSGAGDVNGDGKSDVIVGAPLYDAPHSNEGAAFVFHGGASGIAHGNPGTAADQLESDQGGAQFGIDVAAAGDVNGDGYGDVIVGAWLWYQVAPFEGGAFVFHGSALGIVGNNPSNDASSLRGDQPHAKLGVDVAPAGDVNGDGYADVVVTANGYTAGQANEGAAFVFQGSSTGIANGTAASAAAQLESNQVDAYLGAAAGAGDVNGDGYADVIAGAHLYDAGAGNDGAAFVYLGGAAGMADGNPATAASALSMSQLSSDFGARVAAAGDVNGDGYGDVIVAAPFFDAGQQGEGAAFVFLGSALGIAGGDQTSAWAQLESNQASAFLGKSVAGAGDVNGDGYGDVIAGATNYDNPQPNEGAAFVYHGGALGLVLAALLESDQTGISPNFGASVAGAGDVNGDGYADVIVGSPTYNVGLGGNSDGAAFVFRGSASGIVGTNPATAAARIETDQVGAELGRVAGAGDVNGDGYADVIVGAVRYDATQSDEGAAFVYHGSPSGIANGGPSTAAAQLESNLINAYLGSSVASAGDVNGDGYGDVIVGAQGYTAGQQSEGAAFVFHGSASGIGDGNPTTAASEFQTNQINASAGGLSVAGAGDVNGDGYTDVIVGAGLYDAGQVNEGAAFLLLGSASGIADGTPATAAALLESDEDHSDGGASGFGEAVAGAGDVNGDGLADVIVGARAYDTGSFDGAAWVFLGNNTGGRPALLRQRRGDGSGIPVQIWGNAYSTGFAADLTATHPHGTGRVKVETEACPPGVAFGSASCITATSPSWITVNGVTPQTSISHNVIGLAPGTLYRWRACVLHAASTGTIPANPPHGPWRRVGAQSVEGDIRMPEPELAGALACGVALLVVLAHLGGRRVR